MMFLKSFLFALTINLLSLSLYAQGSQHALSFNGVDDYVDLPDINLGTSFTLEFWMNSSTSTLHQNQLSGGSTSSSEEVGVGFSMNGILNKVRFIVADGSNIIRIYSITDVNDGLWHHIAAVRDGNNFRLYVDGIQEASTSSSMGTGYDNFEPLDIGRLKTGSNYYDGIMDELKIWSVAKSTSEIRDGMCKNGLGNESGLLGYWQMDDGSGSTLTDLTSNGYDGTLKP